MQRNYDNEGKLRQFAELIWPFFKKMFFCKRAKLEFFNQIIDGRIEIIKISNYYEMSMQEIIDSDRYLIELNGPERFFTFTYGEYGT